ncbi:MAG: RNA methyltransferase [Chloroflexi bacterium]|nr:MAG: RNA methyltransferase [Chloroflexota bacterium]
MINFQVRQCTNPACRFRFPVTDQRVTGERCPVCQAPTERAATYAAGFKPEPVAVTAEPVIEVLLDNIRSIYNVGSILRTADGAGLAPLHCCGITPPPDHPKIAKTALGAERSVGWTRCRNGLETAVSLKDRGYQLLALECTPDAILLSDLHLSATQPVVLIVGNELAGVDPDILAICDQTLMLPMQGVKNSLNVASAFAVAAYGLRFAITFHQQGLTMK